MEDFLIVCVGFFIGWNLAGLLKLYKVWTHISVDDRLHEKSFFLWLYHRARDAYYERV